jgi:hypothetical protein
MLTWLDRAVLSALSRPLPKRRRRDQGELGSGGAAWPRQHDARLGGHEQPGRDVPQLRVPQQAGVEAAAREVGQVHQIIGVRLPAVDRHRGALAHLQPAGLVGALTASGSGADRCWGRA